MEPVPFHSMELEFPCSSSIPWNWNFHVPFHGTGISMFQFHSMELEFPCSIPFHGFHGFGVAQTGMELEFPVPFHVPLGSMGLGSSSIPVPCDPAEFHSSSIPCRPSSIPVPFQFHLVPWNWNGTGMELWKMERHVRKLAGIFRQALSHACHA